MDLGVYGAIVVVAQSEEKARVKMANYYTYEEKKPIEAYEINEDFCFANYGDT